MSIQPTVYIMASRRHGTLYVGVTGALRERVYQRREALIERDNPNWRDLWLEIQ